MDPRPPDPEPGAGGPSDEGADDALRRLEQRLNRASEAAERLMAEAAGTVGRAAESVARAGGPPPAGWQVPGSAAPAGRPDRPLRHRSGGLRRQHPGGGRDVRGSRPGLDPPTGPSGSLSLALPDIARVRDRRGRVDTRALVRRPARSHPEMAPPALDARLPGPDQTGLRPRPHH